MKDFPGKKQVERINEEFFAVLEGGKFWVVEEKTVTEKEEGCEPTTVLRHVFGSSDSFSKYWDYEKVQIPQLDKTGKELPIPRLIGLGTHWLGHHLRRTYRRIVFNPMRPCAADEYNLFRGYQIKADSAGSCEKYKDHLKHIVCKDNAEHYDYLIRWMAMAVQRPWQQAKVTVVLRGGQGTGKGSAIEPFGRIFGEHYFYANDPDHIIGKYNYHLAKTILLFGDEAIWAGSKKDESKLKSLITEPRFIAEDKYKPCFQVENRLHIMMATNHEWAVPAAEDDRRFFVLDVSDERKQDSEYFTAIAEEMRQGGSAKLLWELEQLDLSSFNIFKVPKTAGLLQQKIQTFKSDPVKEWYYTKLQDGFIFDGMPWGVPLPTAAVLKDQYNHAKKIGSTSYNMCTPTSFGIWLKKMNDGHAVPKDELKIEEFFITNKYVDDTKAKVQHYYFDDLSTCRERFEKFIGQKIDWAEVSVKVKKEKNDCKEEVI